MLLRCTWRIVLTTLVACAPVRAQSAAGRVSLAAWDDSLQRATTLPQLTVLFARRNDGASIDGLRHLLYALRHGTLTADRQELARVASTALIIRNRHEGWAWPPLVMARTFAAMHLAGWIPLKPDDGKPPQESYADAAWRLLGECLDGDPDFEPARQWYVPLLVAGGDRLLRDPERAFVIHEAARPIPDPDLLLVYGRALRTDRHYDSAVAVFRRAQLLGGNRARLDLELARTLRALHDNRGAAEAYWTGVAGLTPTGRELYRYDLAWIISPDSLKAFDALPLTAVQGWLKRFWDERDAAAANHPGERLDEHLRRWGIAFARYRVRSPWRRTAHTRIDIFFENLPCVHLDRALYALLWKMPPQHEGDLRSAEWLLDHRGILYLRHGEPLRQFGTQEQSPGREDFLTGPPANTPDGSGTWNGWDLGENIGMMGGESGPPGASPTAFTESWVYVIDGQKLVLNFRGSDAIGSYAATTVASVLPFGVGRMIDLAFVGIDAYRDAAVRAAASTWVHTIRNDPPDCWNEVRAAAAQSRSDAHIGASSDTDGPPFMNLWTSVIRMFALGDPGQNTSEALLTFAFAGASLHADTTDDGRFLYSIAFRIVAWEKASGRTISLDTVRHFTRPRPVQGDESLLSWIEMPLPRGEWEVAVRAQQGDSSGAMAVRRDLQLSDGRTTSISDIVLGVAGAPLWTATDGAPFPINATNRWNVGSAAEIYFEVYGIPVGESYRTTVDVRALDPKNHGTIRIGLDGRSTGVVNTVRRTLNLEQLPPGEYQMSVTVIANGHQAVRSQVLKIIPKS